MCSHCAFLSNLFHGQIAQIYIDQLSDPEDKNVVLENFLEQITLKPCNFWAGEALEARRRDNPNITLAQNDIPKFFKFLQKKNSRLGKKAPANFFTIFGAGICKNNVARCLLLFNKCRKSLLSSLEIFFCRNLKNFGMSFWANVMLRQSHVWASRAYPAQKPQGLRLVCSKKFSMAAFFSFLGHLIDGQLFNLFARETNLKKQSSVLPAWAQGWRNWGGRGAHIIWKNLPHGFDVY